MIFYNNIAVVLLLIAIFVLHILSTFLKGRAARILLPLNILMHIALIPALMFVKDGGGKPISLDETVLIYMISLLVYTICFLIAERASAPKKSRIKEEQDDL